MMHIMPYLGPGAIARIISELSCNVFGDAFLKLVYDFMDNFDQTHGPPPLHLQQLPHFHFVRAAIAIEQGKSKTDAQTFLLEEEIDEAVEGKFHKYLNNTSPVPCTFTYEKEANEQQAQSLTFTQHAQYWLTKKLTFVVVLLWFHTHLNCFYRWQYFID